MLFLASCSVQSDEYNTPPPYSAPAEPENPIYDSTPAYEDQIPGNPATLDPGLPPDPGAFTDPEPHTPAASIPQTPAASILHTVEKGDTLSGISARYKVPMDSIRRANNMTSDVVVLGRKMIIPAQ